MNRVKERTSFAKMLSFILNHDYVTSNATKQQSFRALISITDYLHLAPVPKLEGKVINHSTLTASNFDTIVKGGRQIDPFEDASFIQTGWKEHLPIPKDRKRLIDNAIVAFKIALLKQGIMSEFKVLAYGHSSFIYFKHYAIYPNGFLFEILIDDDRIVKEKSDLMRIKFETNGNFNINYYLDAFKLRMDHETFWAASNICPPGHSVRHVLLPESPQKEDVLLTISSINLKGATEKTVEKILELGYHRDFGFQIPVDKNPTLASYGDQVIKVLSKDKEIVYLSRGKLDDRVIITYGYEDLPYGCYILGGFNSAKS